jgi:HEAT repeat protein
MEQVKNQDASVRKIAAYVAGVLGDSRAVEGLLPLLSDPKEDVRWNAALALALLGNADGTDLLMKLLDHSYAETLLDITVEEKNQLRVNSIKALAKLKHEPAQEKIREVSENDPVLAVRSAALEALKTF